VDPSTSRLLLLGDRKLKGLLEKTVDRGSMAIEIMNITAFAKRMTLSIPSLPIAWRVNTLSFQIDPGFFKPQAGHSAADLLTNFLQFGQRIEFLLVGVVIKLSN
jgi:hypothetical protein